MFFFFFWLVLILQCWYFCSLFTKELSLIKSVPRYNSETGSLEYYFFSLNLNCVIDLNLPIFSDWMIKLCYASYYCLCQNHVLVCTVFLFNLFSWLEFESHRIGEHWKCYPLLVLEKLLWNIIGVRHLILVCMCYLIS